MKRLQSIAPALLAAAATAQVAQPRFETRAPYSSSIDASYASVTSRYGDYSGTAVAARFYFYRNVFATVSRNDAGFDGPANLSAHQFAYGVGTSEPWGQGTMTAFYARSKVSGDIGTGIDQNIFSVGYELGLAQSLSAGLAVAHTMNAGSVKDVTAVILSLRLTVVGGFGLSASYSAEDTLLGLSGAKHTWTVGARYSF